MNTAGHNRLLDRLAASWLARLAPVLVGLGGCSGAYDQMDFGPAGERPASATEPAGGKASQAGLEHAPPVTHHQSFTLPAAEAGESMVAVLENRAAGHG